MHCMERQRSVASRSRYSYGSEYLGDRLQRWPIHACLWTGFKCISDKVLVRQSAVLRWLTDAEVYFAISAFQGAVLHDDVILITVHPSVVI